MKWFNCEEEFVVLYYKNFTTSDTTFELLFLDFAEKLEKQS